MDIPSERLRRDRFWNAAYERRPNSRRRPGRHCSRQQGCLHESADRQRPRGFAERYRPDDHRTVGQQSAKDDYDDAEQTIKTQAANGLYHLFDGTNKLISIVAPNGGGVALGSLWSGLDGTHAAARNLDLATFAESIQTTIGNALQQAAKAAILSGVPNATAWLAEIQGGLPSLSFTNLLSSIASLAAPGCSNLVRIAS